MKPFSPLTLVAVLAAAVVSSGCQSTPGARDIHVRLTSETPVSFTGSLLIDGYPKAVSGKTPANFKFHGSRVDCEILQGPEPGTLKVEVQFGAGVTLTATSQGPGQPVKGSFQNQ